MKRYKVYYTRLTQPNIFDDVILSSECDARSKEEAEISTLAYLNKGCVVTKVIELSPTPKGEGET